MTYAWWIVSAEGDSLFAFVMGLMLVRIAVFVVGAGLGLV